MLKGRRTGDVTNFVSRNRVFGDPTWGDLEQVHYWTGTAQVVSSEGHPYQKLGKTTSQDIGGPFLNVRMDVDSGGLKPEWMRYNYWDWYRGGTWQYEKYLVPLPSFTALAIFQAGVDFDKDLPQELLTKLYAAGAPSASSDSHMDALGANLVDSVRPTNPVADLAEFIGEFISERKFFSVPGKAGSLSGEYLNYMFGIAPTVSMVQDLRDAMLNSEKLIAQYRRDSGRLVRRRYHPPPTVSTETVDHGLVYPVALGGDINSAMSGPGSYKVHRKVSDRIAFSGAFTYYLPKEGWMKKVRELDRLYGVVPGMDTVWNLLPFSWLVDYKLSIGSAIANANAYAMDGLVMQYGYVMRERLVHEEHVWSGHLRDGNGALVPRTLSVSANFKIQERRPANPFGFGISHEDLTPRQLSILAALGLSRV